MEIEGQKVLATEGMVHTVLLAGGRHTQLYSLMRIRQPVDEGFEVVPVNPSRFLYYSWMSPGVRSRIYHPQETG